MLIDNEVMSATQLTLKLGVRSRRLRLLVLGYACKEKKRRTC